MRAALATWLGRWPIALAASALLAVLVLLPALGASGLWEPQERTFADLKAPRAEVQAERDRADAEAEAARLAKAAGSAEGSAAAPGSNAAEAPLDAAEPAPAPTQGRSQGSGATPPGTAGVGAPSSPTSKPKAAPVTTTTPDTPGCAHTAPKDALARSLTGRAAAFGRDWFGDDDTGRRLPLALLGILTALAITGTAMRLAGPRAGLLACVVGLSFPLLVLQSRQLTSEIGTACGAALVVYGAVAIGGTRARAIGLLDALLGVIALVAGIYLGFAGGGALLGVTVPLGAVGLAGGFGAPALRGADSPLRGFVALICGLLALAALGYLVYSVIDLVPPKLGAVPPQREMFGRAIVSSPCWASPLGGTWRADDDTRQIFDSTWEQIAYGTYPWGLLAPIAFAALLRSPNEGRRRLGAIALAWAGCAWIATEVFQRKVGIAIFAGFPALAIASGAWLDELFAAPRETSRATALLVALFAVVAALDIGKELNMLADSGVRLGADKLTALLIGGNDLSYPTQAKLLEAPLKLWILLIGMGIACALATAVVARERARVIGAAVAVALTACLAAFWSFAWQPILGESLSSKSIFDAYLELRKPGEPLVMMNELSEAAHDYLPDDKPELVTTREQVVKALGRPGRVFAVAPSGERCQLHREIGGKPYFVVDDRNTRNLLLSNRLDGATDKNPLATAIVHAEPPGITTRPKAPIVFDNKIQLIGWDIPKTVGKNDRGFEVTLFYKVRQTPGGTWKVLMHFDGTHAPRFNGDHPPINDLCATSTWQKDDYIIDHHVVTPGGFADKFDVWTGFFTGSSPNFKNMPISEAPGDLRDPANTDRVKITTITLE